MNILQALDDRQVFAPHLRGNSWGAWRVFLAALFGLPMSEQQLAIYHQVHWPQRRHQQHHCMRLGWCAGAARENATSLLLSPYSWPRSETGVPSSVPVKSERSWSYALTASKRASSCATAWVC